MMVILVLISAVILGVVVGIDVGDSLDVEVAVVIVRVVGFGFIPNVYTSHGTCLCNTCMSF